MTGRAVNRPGAGTFTPTRRRVAGRVGLLMRVNNLSWPHRAEQVAFSRRRENLSHSHHAKHVAGRFAFSRRRENLSWSHHAEQVSGRFELCRRRHNLSWPLIAARAKERMLAGKADPDQKSGQGGKTRDAAKEWIIRNQFARRNLEPFSRLELGLLLKPLIAERAKERQGERTDIDPTLGRGSRTDRELAAIVRLSHGMIAMGAFVADRADDDAKAKDRQRAGGVEKVPQISAEAKETRAEVAKLAVADWWDIGNGGSAKADKPDCRAKVSPDPTPATNKAGLSGAGWQSPALLAGRVGKSG